MQVIRLGILIGFLLNFICTTSHGADGTAQTIRGFAQGTTYQITYYATHPMITKRGIDSIVSVIDSSMSLYKPHSLINQFNDDQTTSIVLDIHFKAVMEKSFEIYRLSNGVFDVTVAPLVELWGFGPKRMGALPDSAAVKSSLACVGMDKLRLIGDTLVKTQPCVQVDVNGIAQGYTVDLIASFLERNGAHYYLVELGGELRVKGPKPDGTPLRIGIERPFAQSGDGSLMPGVMAINNGAVTTAGNYRKFVEDGENTLSHHIDPKTGYPFQTEIISATLYAPDAMTADGLDNVVMAMDAGEAIEFVDTIPGVEVFIIYIDHNGETAEKMSEAFNKLLIQN